MDSVMALPDESVCALQIRLGDSPNTRGENTATTSPSRTTVSSRRPTGLIKMTASQNGFLAGIKVSFSLSSLLFTMVLRYPLPTVRGGETKVIGNSGYIRDVSIW